jgi:hypothetical protein
VSNTNTRNVSVLLGDGSGGFGTPTTFDVGQVPEFLTSADLNGDGKVDLATANESSKDVSVLLNNAFIGDPAPSFARAANFDVENGPEGIISADLNDDTKPDLAVANQIAGSSSVGSLSVLLNTTPFPIGGGGGGGAVGGGGHHHKGHHHKGHHHH